MFGAWWRKNVIEKVHAAAYSGKFTIQNPTMFKLVQLTYFTLPVVGGMWIMSMVTEGGAWHQGAKEEVLAKREELLESHRRRIEEQRKGAKIGDVLSDTRLLGPTADPAVQKQELESTLQASKPKA
mmetsp:Transcript_46957/g.73491  ORF Transcript_46957/g.73491 Transcript_46957/m.73491 type:complete len:126 (-) Transcript_46957:369-746(-)|eukprot:CAMPEP_0184323744 /NCGR_PEP_ID=MMETSP1049-20130417/131868_1 /TAXON_ID=77928 /ORGANISM="Proteomonas sulcata, Strain CCMP704" /LENGTH=125 /DNA_ID=CAMNT_0026645323 /DNA_START=71 /DNA_END=448 /DNA_ORIENTATION=+